MFQPSMGSGNQSIYWSIIAGVGPNIGSFCSTFQSSSNKSGISATSCKTGHPEMKQRCKIFRQAAFLGDMKIFYKMNKFLCKLKKADVVVLLEVKCIGF